MLKPTLENMTPQEWLQQLQQELIEDREQEEFQADPIYYGILNVKEHVTAEGYEDRTYIYDNESCETVSIQDIWESLSHEEQMELADEVLSGVELQTNDVPVITDADWFTDHICNNSDRYNKVYVEDIPFVAADACFLTRKAAKQYLHNNRHHYSKDACTYAMTTDRNPQYETLLWLLKQIDFKRSNIVLKEDTAS